MWHCQFPLGIKILQQQLHKKCVVGQLEGETTRKYPADEVAIYKSAENSKNPLSIIIYKFQEIDKEHKVNAILIVIPYLQLACYI